MKLTLLCAPIRVAVVLFLLPVAGVPQAPDQPAANSVTPAPAKPQFFGGAVAEINDQHIKVARTLIGRPIETRTFLINSGTQVNKASVKLKARVTVRYRHQSDGDVALEIQLRPTVHASSKP